MLRRGHPRLTVVMAVCTLALAACGSQIPPKQFVDHGGFGATPSMAPSGRQAAQLGLPNSPEAGTGVPLTGTAGPTAGATPAIGGGATAVGTTGATASASGGTRNTAAGGTAPVGFTAGSCAGFTNTTGITNSAITVANASDLSGPISGLFTSAQQAVKAYLDYFNSTSSICGRKLNLISLDSQTSESGDEQAAATACSQAFAMVGSMATYDSGGAGTVTHCGIPDLRAITINPPRADSPVSFSTDSLAIPQVPSAPYDYIKKTYGDAYQHAALLYLDVGATTINGQSFMKAEQALGFKFVYSQAVPVTEFNYATYVAAMQSAGVKYIQWVGDYQAAIQLKKAMVTQGFDPVFQMDSVAYDPNFAKTGGSDVNGTLSFVDTALFEEASKSPEMQLYLKWLHIVAPGANPSFFGIFAWGAARLFTETALRLGGKLTRASLLAAYRQVRNYTANGLFAPMQIGAKTSPPCQAVIQLENGVWVRRSPYPFACGTIVSTGVGK